MLKTTPFKTCDIILIFDAINFFMALKTFDKLDIKDFMLQEPCVIE